MTVPGMGAGKLRTLAELQQKIEIPTPAGGRKVTWARERDVWCRIRGLSSRLKLEAMAREPQITHEIIVRQEEDIDATKRLVVAQAGDINNLLEGVEAHWSLDEAAGSNRVDSTPNGNDAIDNESTPAEPGVIATAARAGFGGSVFKFLTVPNDPAFVFGDEDFTIAGYFWINTNSESHAVGGLWNQSGVNRRSYVLLWQQGVLSLRLAVSADGTAVTTLDFPWNTIQTFAHFAAIHDSVNNQLRLHVTPLTASEVAAAATISHSGGVFQNTTDTLDIGRVRVSTTIVGNSRIDELAIWRRALTTGDLNDHFNGGAGLPFAQWAGGGRSFMIAGIPEDVDERGRYVRFLAVEGVAT